MHTSSLCPCKRGNRHVILMESFGSRLMILGDRSGRPKDLPLWTFDASEQKQFRFFNSHKMTLPFAVFPFSPVRNFYVYILTNRKYGVLCVGVTNDIIRRVYEHKQKVSPGFTARYNLNCSVYFEHLEDPVWAISREKQPKGWLRSKKIALIAGTNPEWKDLSEGWYEEESKSNQEKGGTSS